MNAVVHRTNDEKVLITFNYKDGTKTIAFDEIAAKDAPEGQSFATWVAGRLRPELRIQWVPEFSFYLP
ncbi:hypothetical protein ACKXF4_08325 [Faecalibacterium prausnitzii]|uniref:hypothetical protein n=1 Tax=Faecalibacterium prausnitzii TaxID=853 RepID=UPI003AAC4D55